ncbi:MAG: hypothetical protein JWN86_422 [Planctomycetota bacterium]|nr:hypothetical protein [Planctomycetota bacterium]
MKRITALLAFATLILAGAGPCFAEMDIEFVSKERAKKLGMEIRLKGNGPDQFWVELEFKAEGELKDFDRVTLEIREGEKLLVGYAPLQPHPSTSGRVLVGFMADRAYLDKVTLRVVSGKPINYIGRELRVRDFVDLKKPR